MKVDYKQILDALRLAGMPSGALHVCNQRIQNFKDRYYMTIQSSTILKSHRSWVKGLDEWGLAEKRAPAGGARKLLPKWIENCFDCDNHALDFQAYMCKANARTQTETNRKREGMAVGRISYRAESNGRLGGHAINVFLDKDMTVCFFEPADGNVIRLSKKEIESICDISFS